MRGKHYPAQSHLSLHGITPADAGKTPPLSQICRHDKDHPRGCGENCPIAQPRYLGRGSPPRMRGKLRGHLATVKQNGITPADAGKTFLRAETTVLHEDHPRGCGENWLSDLWGGIKNGSPPRMRGKLPTRWRQRNLKRDHPRGCGENVKRIVARCTESGSPPRMRGKRPKP